MTQLHYTVRTSRRAKHLRLTISHRDGLVVVAPVGFDRRKIGEFIEKKRSWIEKHLARVEEARKKLQAEEKKPLPNHIALAAISEEWSVEYRFVPAYWGRLEEQNEGHLLLCGDVKNHVICKQLLRRWLRHKAKLHLLPWIRSLSEEVGLPFRRVAIRDQRTRWASCSSRQNISLNQKLLFLAPQLARHVFIHELCHTVHPSHSSAFWSLLGEKDSKCRELNTALRSAWRYVPGWAEKRIV
jgi:predicted metal-dependent hydrolase